jgi:hypothetical protein
MSAYFTGPERLETFEKTGAPIRMGDVTKLALPDYQVVRNLIKEKKFSEAESYVTAFHAQNTGMIIFLFDWCMSMPKLYAELTNSSAEESLRESALQIYQKNIDKMGNSPVITQVKNYFTQNNILTQTSAQLIADLETFFQELIAALKNQSDESTGLLNDYHQQALTYHDSMITFSYSYPTSIVKVSGEKIAVEVSNGSIMRNPIWNGLWELTKVLTPTDLSAFLAEHLRFHFSGIRREGQTLIAEDEQKIRLIFDPCGSGGALRQRLKDDIVTLKDKHDLAWNKCGEVNLYCTHCALNEKRSIDLFGYPKLVVEFNADADKPCGWTFYKDKKYIPNAVFERLGLKAPVNE